MTMNASDVAWEPGHWNLALLLVLGLACVFRLWGTWYGLPFSYYDDEYHEVMRALELGTGGFNFERTGKGGFYFLLFLEYGFFYVCLKVLGIVDSTREFAEYFVRDPTAFYLIGRVTAALIGTFTVAAAIYFGKRAYGTTAGILAGLFLAINVLHMDLSRLIGVDVPMTMLAAIALCFALRIAEGGTRRDYLLAALFAGLATTTKLPGILLLIPLLISHGYAVANRDGTLRSWLRSPELWLAGATIVLLVVVTNPGLVTRFDFLSLFTQDASQSVDDMSMESADALVGTERPNLYLYYLRAVGDSMGWPLFGLGLISAAYALRRRTAADVILLSYAVANYIAISSTTSEMLYYPRYALPIIFVLAILGGRGLADAMRAMSRRGAMAATVAVTILVVLPLRTSLSTAHDLTVPDTRTLAKNWFDSHIEPGSRVLVEGLKIGPLRSTVPLHETPEAILRRIEYWRVKEPKQAKFLELQLAVHPGGGYDLELVRPESTQSLDEYLARGVEYFVIRPAAFTGTRKANFATVRLVKNLGSDTRVVLLKRFPGSSRLQFGPTIEIYGLANKGGQTGVNDGG
jgi:4-amino-4-deoxy-L-arabinose transferase-like glycosyltransferase